MRHSRRDFRSQPSVDLIYERETRRSQRQTHLAMNLFLLLALAVPLSYLAFLSLLALLGLMTLGAAIHALGTVRALACEHRALHHPALHARHRVHIDRGCVVAVMARALVPTISRSL